MKNDLKLLNSIKIQSIILIVFAAISIILLIVFILFFTDFIFSHKNPETVNESTFISFVVFLVVLLIFTSISSIWNLVLSIIILAQVWENKVVSDSKILWGLLALFLLGSIATLIFSVTNIKKIKSISPENEINNIEAEAIS